MSPTMASLGLDKLSWDDRIVLAYELMKSVETERSTCSLTESQRAELRRRAEEADLHPEDGIPWEEVKAKGRSRIGETKC